MNSKVNYSKTPLARTLGVFWENSYFLRSLSGIKYKIIKNGNNSKLFHKELKNNSIQIYIKNITVRIIFLTIDFFMALPLLYFLLKSFTPSV